MSSHSSAIFCIARSRPNSLLAALLIPTKTHFRCILYRNDLFYTTTFNSAVDKLSTKSCKKCCCKSSVHDATQPYDLQTYDTAQTFEFLQNRIKIVFQHLAEGAPRVWGDVESDNRGHVVPVPLSQPWVAHDRYYR